MEEVASIRPDGMSWSTEIRDSGTSITFTAGPVFAEALADSTAVLPSGTLGENEERELHAHLQQWINFNRKK